MTRHWNGNHSKTSVSLTENSNSNSSSKTLFTFSLSLSLSLHWLTGRKTPIYLLSLSLSLSPYIKKSKIQTHGVGVNGLPGGFWLLCSVQDDIYGPLRKPIRAPPSVSQSCLWNNFSLVSVWSEDDPFPSAGEWSSSAPSLYTSLLQAIDSVLSLALCPHVVSQAPQHFNSLKR